MILGKHPPEHTLVFALVHSWAKHIGMLGQDAHWVSVIALHAETGHYPTGQVLQFVQVPALVPVQPDRYCPPGHDAQSVHVPAKLPPQLARYLPGWQSPAARHSVQTP